MRSQSLAFTTWQDVIAERKENRVIILRSLQRLQNRWALLNGVGMLCTGQPLGPLPSGTACRVRQECCL
jgi:hypothetical protein